MNSCDQFTTCLLTLYVISSGCLIRHMNHLQNEMSSAYRICLCPVPQVLFFCPVPPLKDFKIETFYENLLLLKCATTRSKTKFDTVV